MSSLSIVFARSGAIDEHRGEEILSTAVRMCEAISIVACVLLTNRTIVRFVNKTKIYTMCLVKILRKK